MEITTNISQETDCHSVADSPKHLTRICEKASEIPFLMQEVKERFRIYGKDFSWTKFEFDALRARICMLGEEISDLHIEEISAIWDRTLGPLSEVKRPTKMQHRADPMIAAFNIRDTSCEIVTILERLHIPANIAKNPYFTSLGVTIVPDDFFGGIEHDKRACQTLMTENEMQVREEFLREKVVLKESNSDEFKASIMQSYAKILTLKGGLAFLEDCLIQSKKEKLPLVYSSEITGVDSKEKRIQVKTSSNLSAFCLIKSRYTTYISANYLMLIHELQHCCKQDLEGMKFVYRPTHFDFTEITDICTNDLWSNDLEKDAISTENIYRYFYPERIFHFSSYNLTNSLAISILQQNPVLEESMSYFNLRTKILEIKMAWLCFVLPWIKVNHFLIEKSGELKSIDQINKEKQKIIQKFEMLLFLPLSTLNNKWPGSVLDKSALTFIDKQELIWYKKKFEEFEIAHIKEQKEMSIKISLLTKTIEVFFSLIPIIQSQIAAVMLLPFIKSTLLVYIMYAYSDTISNRFL